MLIDQFPREKTQETKGRREKWGGREERRGEVGQREERQTLLVGREVPSSLGWERYH